MSSEVTKRGEFGMDFIDSDMMMMLMMIMMMSVMAGLIGPMTEQAQAQTQMLQAQSYHGTEDPRTVNVTNLLSWTNLIYDYPFRPWISAYLINDGPSAVEVGINYPDDRFTMNPGETVTINRTGAIDEKINIIFYICRPGLRSSLRITGEY